MPTQGPRLVDDRNRESVVVGMEKRIGWGFVAAVVEPDVRSMWRWIWATISDRQSAREEICRHFRVAGWGYGDDGRGKAFSVADWESYFGVAPVDGEVRCVA